ncbi:Os11g0642100 [Oryza sativa Japonica Group]|uniref:F-box domain containing protein, expressed n=2 Tax=Oryza sativa subsp. japonica TaxID=39947 RepID=Q2R0K5_ORYSJ|nr:uncharacterized protein LOC4351007 [Oryza sativa Japonica Group]ABA95024.1 F-box domain containing protein, expressed [Oryza sativa Japonica Group]KAF2911861.1 hypothetical protein DAI22_11g212100 [Oryza sativa Japonica Group]USI00760.1 F-box domain-containing protein [Oryza sativa Japonica Group]BAF28718.1 Os11g0642100 [Oryza sativa Japonica Group]BAT15017.1 Os11g0642100 [Oryza sativa Japonica Group]|eukprot:NP_001068355.1 Os11g0642100 [Oryza sativa Japonica Group]
MATGDDRLSDLPDELVLRILHFANAKEAASTSLLSRPFGALWRSSGAVNLAARVPCGSRYIGRAALIARRDAFVRAAEAALSAAAAADHRVTRLTVHIECDKEDKGSIASFLLSSENDERRGHRDVFDAVLSHPAARRVEELSVAAVHPHWGDKGNIVSSHGVGIYSINPANLPSNTLRVLDLTNCRSLAPSAAAAAAAAFPRLETLRLRHCTTNIDDLHRIIDAAPELAAVRLEFVHLISNIRDVHFLVQLAMSSTTRLRFPAATALTLINCLTNGGMSGSVIDAPRLRSLTYKGAARSQFELTSPAPDMKMVHLHFNHYFHQRDYLRFIHNFTKVKVLKLKAEHGCPWRILPQHCSPRARRRFQPLEQDGEGRRDREHAPLLPSALRPQPESHQHGVT